MLEKYGDTKLLRKLDLTPYLTVRGNMPEKIVNITTEIHNKNLGHWALVSDPTPTFEEEPSGWLAEFDSYQELVTYQEHTDHTNVHIEFRFVASNNMYQKITSLFKTARDRANVQELDDVYAEIDLS